MVGEVVLTPLNSLAFSLKKTTRRQKNRKISRERYYNLWIPYFIVFISQGECYSTIANTWIKWITLTNTILTHMKQHKSQLAFPFRLINTLKDKNYNRCERSGLEPRLRVWRPGVVNRSTVTNLTPITAWNVLECAINLACTTANHDDYSASTGIVLFFRKKINRVLPNVSIKRLFSLI